MNFVTAVSTDRTKGERKTEWSGTRVNIDLEVCVRDFQAGVFSPIADLEASASHRRPPLSPAEDSQEPDDRPDAYRKCRSCGELIDCR